MKKLLIVAALICAQCAFAQTNENTMEMSEHESNMLLSSNWNVNIGLSTLEVTAGYEGKGLSLELQRRLGDYFFLGASYTNFKLEIPYSDYYYGDSLATYNIDFFTLSGEAHPIHLDLSAIQSEFFVAINAGLSHAQRTGYSSGVDSGSFYGAGVGFNYNDQMGLRLDTKYNLARGNENIESTNSISAVGYF